MDDFNKKYKIKDLNKEEFQFVGSKNVAKSTSLVGKPKKLWKEIFKRFFTNWYAGAALFIFIVIFLMAIIIPYVSPYKDDATITNQLNRFIADLPPSSTPQVTKIITQDWLDNLTKIQQTSNINFIIGQPKLLVNSGDWEVTYNAYTLLSIVNGGKHFTSILGTTDQGFDIWTRSWGATIQSLILAIIVATVNAFVGVSLGLYLGFHIGKPIDTFFSRVTDIINGLPALIWVLVLVSIIGTGFGQLILIMILIGWSGPVQEARFFAITVKDEEYVSAAEAVGTSKLRRIYVHVFPAIAGKLGISFVQSIPNVILTISSLAFLGFLTNPANANLGTVLNQAVGNFSSNPWSLIFPALILLTVTLSLQFVAMGVHDALDPKVKKAI